MSDTPTDLDRLDHLLQIARCPVIAAHFENGGGPCAKVIREQWSAIREQWPPDKPGPPAWRLHHQDPEPWSGHIDTAPILFVASNPSTGNYEAHLDRDPPTGYPTVDSSRQATEEYFELRFDRHIEAGIRNTGKKETVRYWKGVRTIAQELVCGRDVNPGVDYALTEVVRCKSKGQKGVENALETCTKLYLDKTLACSPAAVIVVTGDVAGRHFRTRPELAGFTGPVSPPVHIAGHERRVVIVAHPANQHGLKYRISDVAPQALEELRAVLAPALAA